MTVPRIYRSGDTITGGSVSVGTGDNFFTGTGTQFAGADLEGAQLFVHPVGQVPKFVGTVAAIEPRYPEGGYPNLGPIALVYAWEGAPIVEQPYILLLSAAGISAATATALFGRFVAFLENKAGLFFDGRDTPAGELTPLVTRAIYYDATVRLLRSWRGGQFDTLDVVGAPFNGQGPWVVAPEEKTALAISTGEVPIDYDLGAIDPQLPLGAHHFKLLADEPAELQLPTNVETGDRILVEIEMLGGPNAITFAEGYDIGDAEIEPADGALTLIAIEVSAEDGGTATAATVSRFVYDKNALVAHKGFAYVSNIDVNTAEPQVAGGAPVSTSPWTALPSVQGERGEAGLAGYAYRFDNSTNTGANPAAGFLRVNDPDLQFVTAVALALVDNDGINRQDQIESLAIGDSFEIKVRDGAAVFAEYRLTAVPTIVSSRAVLTVALVDKMGALSNGGALDLVFRRTGDQGVPGADGTDPGALFNWDDAPASGDPGAGNIAADNADLSAATTLYVSKLNREGDSVAAWLATLASSTNAHKADIFLNRSGSDAQAIFKLTGLSVEADHVELAVEAHSGADGFVNGAISLQAARTGNDAEVVGDVSSVNGETGDVVLDASDIDTTAMGTFEGLSVEFVLDEHDGRIVDLEAEAAAIPDKVDKATYDANTILAANTDNTPAAVTVAEQRIVGRKTGGNITALTGAEVRGVTGQALDNLAATAAPTVNDDIDLGYGAGSLWFDTTNGRFYYCLSATDGAALWVQVAHEAIVVECSNETTALTAGTAKKSFFMPKKLRLFAGKNGVKGWLKTAQASGSTFTVDINASGTSIISTKLTWDSTEQASDDAAAPPVLQNSPTVLALNTPMTVDIDQIGNGTAKGLVVGLYGVEVP